MRLERASGPRAVEMTSWVLVGPGRSCTGCYVTGGKRVIGEKELRFADKSYNTAFKLKLTTPANSA
jgi:hypothetical protein